MEPQQNYPKHRMWPWTDIGLYSLKLVKPGGGGTGGASSRKRRRNSITTAPFTKAHDPVSTWQGSFSGPCGERAREGV